MRLFFIMFYALISFELPPWFPFPLHSYNLSSFFYLLSYWLIFWEREGYCVCKYELYILYITCLYNVVYWPFPTLSPPPPSYIHQYHGNRIPLSHSFKPWSRSSFPTVNPHSILRTPTCSRPFPHLVISFPPTGLFPSQNADSVHYVK